MHRTEGDGYVLESGLRRFVDQNLPTTPGTVHPAEWDNAVQEELCYLITAAGITVASTALADRSAGWHQLYDAIFDSEALDTGAIADDAVTNVKIASCGLSKLIYVHADGGVDISYVSGGATYNLSLSPLEFDLAYTSGVSNISNIQVPGQFAIVQKLSGVVTRSASVTYDTGFGHVNDTNNDSVTLNSDGLGFEDNGVPSGETLRFRVLNLDGATWAGTGPYYTTISTGLSSSLDSPLTATLRYRTISTGNVTIASSLGNTSYKTLFIVNGAGWDVQVTVNENITTATYNQRKLTVWYG